MKTIYTGGDIITLEPMGYAEAVLVDGERIAAVGRKEEIVRESGKGAEIVNLQGRTMLPAFIDAHSHITAYAQTLGFANLSEAKNFREIQEEISTFYHQAKLKPGETLIGFGYDHNQLEEGVHPDKSVLDSLDFDCPIVITHTSGHMGVINSIALRQMGITKDTSDPIGGKIGRLADGLTPNGYLEEAAFISKVSQLSAPDRQKNRMLLERAQNIYASYGIAMVQDGLTDKDAFSLLQEGPLFLDTAAYVDIAKCPEILDENPAYFNRYQNHLKIAGGKLILDGSPQGRTAWLTKPYEDAKDGYCGYPVYEDQEVYRYLKMALDRKFQILVHCNGDAAAEQMVRCYRRALADSSAGDYRPVMIHAQLLRPELLPEIKRLGIIPSFFTAHTYFWGDVHSKNLGKRAQEISPAASAAALGIPFTFHQDTPVLPPDMIKTIWCAVNRKTKGGVVLGAQERITPYQAIQAVTIHTARQYFEEAHKGSIQPGKEANFVILSQNPLKTAPEELDQIEVMETRIRNQIVGV